MTFTCHIDTPLGRMLAAAEENEITGLWFEGQKYFPKETEAWQENPDYPVFEGLRAFLEEYFTGKNPQPAFPLNHQGSAFGKIIWELLLGIPYGQTTTYGRLAESAAKRLGLKSMSAQAVGGAVGHNPISILIPCHRVVGKGGDLTGYAGGLERKRALLELEAGAKRETGSEHPVCV